MGTAQGRAAVLVVDDEPGIRDLLAFELGQDGFDVETAASGPLAIDALKRRKFDLAVTDLKMPGMDGIQTVEALRAIDPDIEVIVATGYATVETAVACMKGGAYDYIQKPYDLEELKLLLGRAMEKSDLHGVLALYEASRALLGTLHLSDLVEVVLELAARVLRADGSALALEHDLGGRKLHRATEDHPPDAVVRALVEAGWARGGPVCVPCGPEQRGTCDLGPYASALAYPLAARGQAVGTLLLLRSGASPPFSSSELRRGTVFASQLTMALENARLFQELEQRMAQIQAMQDELLQSEKLGLCSQLTGFVAHEINNPLCAVRANLDALKDYSTTLGGLWLAAKCAAAYLSGLPAPSALDVARTLTGEGAEGRDATVREMALVIDETLECVRRIADLVTGFARLAEPALAAPPEPIDLGGLVSECLALLAEEPTQRPQVVADGVARSCRASRADLGAALANVLGFLCDRPGASAASSRVSIRLEARTGGPAILITDATLALSDEERARVFDPRLRAVGTESRSVRLDIGLAIAYQLLKRNGCQITIADTPDRNGATFVLQLPASDLAA